MADATTEMRLQEPYERFPCNQLRSECYRRKLVIVKTGPQANATKAGYLRLLREHDEAQGSQAATSDARTAVAMEPSLVLTAGPPPRVVSPPTSPMVFVELPPQRPPRVELTHTFKRDSSADADKSEIEVQEKKRRKIIEPQPLSDRSFFSTQTSTSATPSVNNDQDLEPAALDVSMPKNSDPAEDMNLPRWERLHARLEVVIAKLQLLYGRRDQWLPCGGAGPNDESDIKFYELMKHQLQRGLLECVSDP